LLPKLNKTILIGNCCKTVEAAAGGAYNLNWTAADPAPNNAPFLPTYPKVPPSSLACPTLSGGVRRAGDPLANAEYGAPKDMALGQIVPLEVKISVSGSTSPENGVIQFSPYWLAKTTSGGNFGFDPADGVYCAFVDSADAATSDLGANAKVNSFTSTTAMAGTNNEQIQGTLQVSGLDNGDSVIVEIWVVLKSTISAGVSGNVQTSLFSASTASADTINAGNQTVPLLRVQEFFSSSADISVSKSDSPDPVTQGQQLTNIVNVANNSTNTVANGVVATDTLDPNTTFVSGTWAGGNCTVNSGVVTCNVGALNPCQVVPIIIVVVTVSGIAPTNNDLSTNPETGTCTAAGPGIDLCNKVSGTAITADPNTANNSDSEPTNVLPAIVSIRAVTLVKTATPVTYDSVGDVIGYSYLVTNSGNVRLAGPVTVTDDKATVTCPNVNTVGNLDGFLDPGESFTCTASYSIVQADLNNGTVTNTATASADGTQSNQDQETVTFINVLPDITVTKTASPAPASVPETMGNVTFAFVVTNNGAAAVVITDSGSDSETVTYADVPSPSITVTKLVTETKSPPMELCAAPGRRQRQDCHQGSTYGDVG
jgi:uncharacterized repeat protein (TIGR01451 family)